MNSRVLHSLLFSGWSGHAGERGLPSDAVSPFFVAGRPAARDGGRKTDPEPTPTNRGSVPHGDSNFPHLPRPASIRSAFVRCNVRYAISKLPCSWATAPTTCAKRKGASWCGYGAPFTRGRPGAGLSGLIQTTGGKSPLFHWRGWGFGERAGRCPQLLETDGFPQEAMDEPHQAPRCSHAIGSL